MGDAKRRLEKEGELVEFNCEAIGFRISGGERANLSKPRYQGGESGEHLVIPRAFGIVALNVITAAFPQGMDRRDGKLWAAWQDFIDEEAPSTTVTRGAVDWLAKHVNGESVKVPAQLSAWRESLAEYLEQLANAPAVEQVE